MGLRYTEESMEISVFEPRDPIMPVLAKLALKTFQCLGPCHTEEVYLNIFVNFLVDAGILSRRQVHVCHLEHNESGEITPIYIGKAHLQVQGNILVEVRAPKEFTTENLDEDYLRLKGYIKCYKSCRKKLAGSVLCYFHPHGVKWIECDLED